MFGGPLCNLGSDYRAQPRRRHVHWRIPLGMTRRSLPITALVADRPVRVLHRLWFFLALNRQLDSIMHDRGTPVKVVRLHSQLLQRHIASSKSAADALIEHGLVASRRLVSTLSISRPTWRRSSAKSWLTTTS
jgi:hypothetical protein